MINHTSMARISYVLIMNTQSYFQDWYFRWNGAVWNGIEISSNIICGCSVRFGYIIISDENFCGFENLLSKGASLIYGSSLLWSFHSIKFIIFLSIQDFSSGVNLFDSFYLHQSVAIKENWLDATIKCINSVPSDWLNDIPTYISPSVSSSLLPVEV